MSNEMEYRLATAGDAYERLWDEYLDARDALWAYLAEHAPPGKPCSCKAHLVEPGPKHERACPIWIPFVPKSLEGRYEDETVR